MNRLAIYLKTHPTLSNMVTPGSVVHAGGWNAVFGNEHPLNLEIGIGRGEFLLALAAAHPDENFVGLDLAGKFLRKAATKALRDERANVRFLITDAKAALFELFEHESLAAVYVNFPDPWPKASHEKRRHFEPFFMALLEDRLAVGGLMYLATDVEEYAEQAYEALSRSEILENAYPERWLHDRGWSDMQTRYERKWRDEGKPLYYLAFRKSRGLRTARYLLSREEFSPLHVALPLGEAAGKLVMRTESEAKYVVKVLTMKPAGDHWRGKILLIDKSTGFKDYLHVELVAAGDGAELRLTNAGEIVYTDAKHRALRRFFDNL